MGEKVILAILDGWGLGDGSKADAIAQANTPFVNDLYRNYPHGVLITCGEDVGLPPMQMGNSEVGHMNIGAGRVVYQDFARINKDIREGVFERNAELQKAFAYAKNNHKNLHLIGLISDGGVHSHEAHLIHLCELANKAGLAQIYVHAFTDGRDTDPHSGLHSVAKVESAIGKLNGKVASVIGRYFAMDRDNRWERIKKAYDLLVKGTGSHFKSAQEAIQTSYDANVSDEFIEPSLIVDAQGKPLATIKADDLVICFNFRTDRCREITTALTQKDLPEFQLKTLPLYFVTMTEYDANFKGVHLLYQKDNLSNTLGEVLAKHGKNQIRIAETEKYPHVTFFFSGGREKEFTGEKRIMIASPKVATYDLQPEMSAQAVTDAIVPEINTQRYDFICLNYANIDMVGHTGNYDSAIKAVETVDRCLQQLVEAGLKNGYSFVIIADHGNADCMVNADGSPNTAHTTNLVPCIVISPQVQQVKNGRLADIAPTVLGLMGIETPVEMTGNSLF